MPGTAIRRTEQRRAILAALARSETAMTAQELHARLDGVGLATVYRNLQRLVDEGVADTLLRDRGEQAFLLCEDGHHHHLRCRSCDRVERVRDCRLDAWARAVAREHGYHEVEHQAELVGLCPDCAR